MPIGEIEGAYLIAGDRVRRSLLHLLALRRDQDGLRAVAFLIGTDGPVDLLPLPTTALLDPLLDLPEAVELAPALARVASRRGWAWHACDLLCRLAGTDRLAPEVAADVVATVAPLVLELVDTCDRVVLVQGERSDPTRADRHRIGALVRLLHAMVGDQSDRLLYRVLSAVDPRVAAGAAVALVDHGRPVAPERLELVCRDPEARALLLDGLDDVGRADLVPAPFGRGPQRAEADLVRWLVCETELGSRPDEIEWIGALPIDAGADSPAAAGPGARFAVGGRRPPVPVPGPRPALVLCPGLDGGGGRPVPRRRVPGEHGGTVRLLALRRGGRGRSGRAPARHPPCGVGLARRRRRTGVTVGYTTGLHELGDGLFAYLQPDGSWGWSNAGLVCGDGASLLVDTLFDLDLTAAMLGAMEPVTAGRPIATLVNTHANGDHCYGNQLVTGAEVVASAATAAEMDEVPPSLLAAMVEADLGDDALNAYVADGVRAVPVHRHRRGPADPHVHRDAGPGGGRHGGGAGGGGPGPHRR